MSERSRPRSSSNQMTSGGADSSLLFPVGATLHHAINQDHLARGRTDSLPPYSAASPRQLPSQPPRAAFLFERKSWSSNMCWGNSGGKSTAQNCWHWGMANGSSTEMQAPVRCHPSRQPRGPQRNPPPHPGTTFRTRHLLCGHLGPRLKVWREVKKFEPELFIDTRRITAYPSPGRKAPPQKAVRFWST